MLKQISILKGDITQIAFKVINDELKQSQSVQEVVFVCFDDENFNIYQMLKDELQLEDIAII